LLLDGGPELIHGDYVRQKDQQQEQGCDDDKNDAKFAVHGHLRRVGWRGKRSVIERE